MTKKFCLIFLLVFILFSLPGCNLPAVQTSSENTKEIDSQETAQPVEVLAEAGETVLPSATPEVLQPPSEITEEPEPTVETQASGIGEEPSPLISADNLDKLKIVQETRVEYPYRIKWFNDGSRLGVIVDQNLLFLDGVTLENAGSVNIETPYILLDFSPADDLIAVSKDRTSLELRNTQTGELLREIIPPTQLLSALFTPDGKYIAANLIDEWTVMLWDVQTGEVYKILTGFETAAPVYSFVFSQDSQNLIWIARMTVQPMSIEDGVLGPELYHEDFVNSVALHPDGKILASAAAGTVGEDYLPLIVRWSLPDGQEIDRLVSGEKSVSVLLYSNDGELLFSGGTSLDIWYGAETPYKLYSDGTDIISSIALSADGRKLAAATSEGKFLLWEVVP